MLRWRVIASIAIVLPLAGLIWLDYFHNFGRPGIWLLPFFIALGVMGAEEVLFLLRAKKLDPTPWACYAGTLLVLITAALPIWWPWADRLDPADQSKWILFSLALGMLLAILAEMRRYQKPGSSMVRVGLTIFCIAYIGGLLGFFVRLRVLDHDLPDANAWGMLAILSMVLVVKMSDIGAYFVGSLVGRTKMVPRLSPGKTIEGTCGGLVAACFASWLAFTQIMPWLIPAAPPTPVLHWIAYGLLVAIAGMIGDLAESLFKRDMESKDSSTWLKGLGGVLDVIDSPLIGAPMALFCWEIGLVGPG